MQTPLKENDKSALKKLVEAGKIMNQIYLRQMWKGNSELEEKFTRNKDEESLRKLYSNAGPWERLLLFVNPDTRMEDNRPWLEGVDPKPLGSNYYPEDMTKEEFETWLETLSQEDQKNAKGFYHVVRRDPKGHLILVPYNEEYKEWLEPGDYNFIVGLTLSCQVASRSCGSDRQQIDEEIPYLDAFLSNRYFDSEVAWMEVDSQSVFEVTIGPYEVYEDALFGYKSAFVAYICIRDFDETLKLKKFGQRLQDIEDNLPIDDKFKNKKLGETDSDPIVVVDQIFTGGDNVGVQTAAFNLPNDEKVIEVKGSKQVLLKNVQEAKFSQVLSPIAEKLIDPSQLQHVSFDAFFTHVLCHELCHGLGPHKIIVDGKESSTRQELQELHSAIEEAKADITGLFALQYLIDIGIIEKKLEANFYVTFLAGAFRSIRFGLDEAHGKGQAVQLNYLIDEGGIEINSTTKKFSVNFDKVKQAVRKLASEILTLQAEGSKQKAKVMLDSLGINRSYTEEALASLTDIPIDIDPIVRVDELLGSQ